MTAPTAARWARVTEVLNDALEREPEERERYLAGACRGDPELRAEVESLLAAHEDSGPVDALAAELVAPLVSRLHSLPAPRGRTVAHYRIIDRLGGGGMGVVYRARDTRLDRPVALKFLPPHLGRDPSSKQRFLLEAQAAARLEHPNVCTIYEVGETEGGELFIAMPLYEGDTLRERIERGPLPVEEAVDFALQTARGLAEAHGRGIVHRDVKPANLIVTGNGIVKIVDFGIAKLADVCLTKPGGKLGTVAYMSPEQASGEALDHRTDLWSLGVVLYEMLVGATPFPGEHDQVVLHAILHTAPAPLASHRPDVPAALERLMAKALARRPQDRYATAGEMARELGRVRAADPDSPPAGVLAGGERRQATVVVSCLAGYAELVEALPPDEFERVIGRVRSAAAEVAARHGGALNQFAGDQMVLLFGIPTTHEDDGIRATRAGLELHARVRALSEPFEQGSGPELRLHTGIDTGRVVAHAQPSENGQRAYRVTGSAAQIAVRLASHAGVDEVWASPECQHLINAFFETEAREALTVRDRKQPLVPYRVLEESGLQTRLEAAEKVGLTAYTGREAELATLRRCLADVLQGEGQFATIIGEAGIGKSRLLHEFRNKLDGERASLLVGRCQSYGGGVAYLPFIEILRTGLGLGEPGAGGVLETTLARIREIGPELEEFIPLYLHLLSIPDEEFRVPKHLQGDAFRLAMQEALAAILTLSARRRPSVVLLEDWHWADEASHAVLKQVAEVVSGYPLLVVVTSRPGYGVEWGSPSQHTPIPLRPLEPSSSVSVLKSFLHVESFPEELGTLLHERTGGNPFFLEEICQALLEEGAIQLSGSDASLTGPLQMLDLPDSVQAVIRARLDRLDRDARDVLRFASVVGREFTRGILERTVTDGERLPRVLEMLKTAGLIQQMRVVPEAMYRFKHILTQEVAYASLLEHQRRDLHGRVGAVIEQLHQERIEDHLDRLAHHFSQAEEWEKAVRYGLRSAQRTGTLAQFSEALQILERTQLWLARLPAGADRQETLIDLLLRQERLCETLGLRARQQQIIDELISLLESSRDPARLAEVYLRQGDLHTLLRQFEKAAEALERSLRLRRDLGDLVGQRNTLRSLGLLRWHEDRNTEAFEYNQQALVIDQKLGDPVAIIGDLTNIATTLKAMGEYRRAKSSLEEAIALAEEGPAAGSDPAEGDEFIIKMCYALANLGNVHRELGDPDAAQRSVEQAKDLAREKRLPIQLSYHQTSLAHIYLQQGRVEESIAAYRESVELTRRAKYAPGLVQSLRILGEVLLGLGRYDEALPHLEEAAPLFALLQDQESEALMWKEVADVYERREDHAGALAAWSRVRALRKQTGDAAGELQALEGLGVAARRHVGEPSLALAYYSEAVELARALEDHAAEGRLRNTIGIMEWSRGEYAQALRQYERAFAIFREVEDHGHAGLMLNSAGITLKALGRLDEARDRFGEALASHRRTGQRQLEGHALAALGDLSSERGKAEHAGEYYQQSLEIRRATGDRTGEGWMLYKLAGNNPAGGQSRDVLARASRIAEECGDDELATACEELRRTSGF
ncbi:MAG: tetratricopeptide repeat protein [Gemmatimonadetes bacterium]|nr:tetratricopeptide repeat protein [Gemmatimonadota bacterium]